MEPQLYERPREKLRYKGATSLSKTELFQVLLGSGTPHFHVAKIARDVVHLLDKSSHTVRYDELALLPGLGDAKVCQILAVLELTRRFSTRQTGEIKRGGAGIEVEVLKKAQKPLFIYATYDGSGELIKKRQFKYISKQSKPIVRRISAELITDGAAQFSCAIGWQHHPPMLDEGEWAFIKTLVESIRVLQVSIRSIALVSQEKAIDIKKEIL